MTAHNTLLGYVRTYVPYALGVAIAWVYVTFGIDLNGPFAVAAEALLVGVAINSYYVLFRIVEQYVPFLGVFLGFPKAPIYDDISDLWNSFVRTAIPTVVSAVVVTFFGSAFGLDAEAQAGVITVGVGVVSAIYYSAARAIAAKWPAVNFLLKDAPVAYSK